MAVRTQFVVGMVGALVSYTLIVIVKELFVSGKFMPTYLSRIKAASPESVADDSIVADELKESVRILCWVMTSPANLHVKAISVKNTWGRRCNILLFMSSETDNAFPAIGVETDEGRDHLTAKTMHAFKYVFDHHLNEADWFFKADDDTYVIIENMRLMLMGVSPEEPVYYGHHFKTIVKPQGYHSGGGGYVLSREALRRFGERGFHQAHVCAEDGGAEDVEMGRCMQSLGVSAASSLDRLGGTRFHCLNPVSHLHGRYPDWYFHYDSNGAKHGVESISNFPVTFHYVNPQEMLNLEYFVYHLKPFGSHRGHLTQQLHNIYAAGRANLTETSQAMRN